MKSLIFVLLIAGAFTQPAFGWGKRGHALVAEAAAYALEEQAPFLKNHSFDLAYYNNVPDIIWKRTETQKFERPEHFVDLEIIERVISDKASLSGDRDEFFKKYPSAREAGFALWRIGELCAELDKTQQEKRQRQFQLKWLTVAGVIGHYFADLSQPLHTTENSDGQLTGQKGIHAYYESDIVNEIYPDIAKEVFALAKTNYQRMKTEKVPACFYLAYQLAQESHKEVSDLLKRDKGDNRKDIKKSAAAHSSAIVAQLGRGAAYLALAWSTRLNWQYVGKEFWDFDEHPKYIKPGKAPVKSRTNL